jgi:hypothetical protein
MGLNRRVTKYDLFLNTTVTTCKNVIDIPLYNYVLFVISVDSFPPITLRSAQQDSFDIALLHVVMYFTLARVQ